MPETEEYGIESFVYRARPPFDPAEFHTFFNRKLAGVIRAKGHFWLATRPQWVGEFSLAGATARVHVGLLVGGRAEAGARAAGHRRATRNPQWHEPRGDRRQEIVFIGAGMDEAGIRRALDACLMEGPTPWRINSRVLWIVARSIPRLGPRACGMNVRLNDHSLALRRIARPPSRSEDDAEFGETGARSTLTVIRFMCGVRSVAPLTSATGRRRSGGTGCLPECPQP